MKARPIRFAAALLVATSIAGCAVVPTSPYIAALPGSRTTAGQFAADDQTCRGQAQAWFGAGTQQRADQAAAANVVAGTLIGAALGALFGAAVGDAGVGAAIGAGTGLFGGSVAAADMSGYSSAQMQAQYDRVYLQCMYAAGHRVPSSFLAQQSQRYPVPSTDVPAAGYPPSNTPPPPRSYPPPSTVAPPAGFPPPDTPPPAVAPRS